MLDQLTFKSRDVEIISMKDKDVKDRKVYGTKLSLKHTVC